MALYILILSKQLAAANRIASEQALITLNPISA